MKRTSPSLRISLALALGAVAATSHAGVVVHGSRVVYPAEQRGISVRLENNGDVPSLVQAWIQSGAHEGSSGSLNAAPFVIRPPIFRMESGRSQVVRIMHTGESMPADRESLYYFNVLDVPARQSGAEAPAQKVHLVVRSQLMFFYRPKGLSSAGALNAAKQLQWSLSKDSQGWSLNALNPTPYYIGISKITAGEELKAGLAPPRETTSYRLTQAQYNALGNQVSFVYSTDLGKKIEATAPLARP